VRTVAPSIPGIVQQHQVKQKETRFEKINHITSINTKSTSHISPPKKHHRSTSSFQALLSWKCG
jgi:hypothetical protein